MDYRTRSNTVRAEARAHLIRLRNERLAKRGIKPASASGQQKAEKKADDIKTEATDYTSSPEILQALGLEADAMKSEAGASTEISEPKNKTPKAPRSAQRPEADEKKLAKKKSTTKQKVKSKKTDTPEGVYPSEEPENATVEKSSEVSAISAHENEHKNEMAETEVEIQVMQVEPPEAEISHSDSLEAQARQSESSDETDIEEDKTEPTQTVPEHDHAQDQEAENNPELKHIPNPSSAHARSATRPSLASLKRPASSMRALAPVASQLNPYSLERLPMIGPGLVWHLQKAGIHSLDDLAHADVDTLVSKLGEISRLMRLAEWVELAKTTSETRIDEAKSA